MKFHDAHKYGVSIISHMKMYLLRDLKLSNHSNFIVHLDPTLYKIQFSAVKV